MPNMQNTYTNDMSMRTMDGRQMEPVDWSSEITAARPPQMRNRQPLDTGFGGMAGNGAMSENHMSPGGMALAQSMHTPPDMSHGQPSEVIEAPTSLQEAYLGSLKAMLNRNKGNYVVATFLIGTQNTVSWEGILYEVGNDFVTIYQPGRDRYVVIDMYSLKYMEFYDMRRREMCDRFLQQNGWQQNGWQQTP